MRKFAWQVFSRLLTHNIKLVVISASWKVAWFSMVGGWNHANLNEVESIPSFSNMNCFSFWLSSERKDKIFSCNHSTVIPLKRSSLQPGLFPTQFKCEVIWYYCLVAPISYTVLGIRLLHLAFSSICGFSLTFLCEYPCLSNLK